jgi:hypothetical protein
MKKILFSIVLIFFALLFSCKQEIKIYPADNDKEFIDGSKINIEQYDNQTIENLSVLCKVWGFLKYYHPAIAEGKYNWDFELFRIIPSILNTTPQERNSILSIWIENLGEVKLAEKIQALDSIQVKMYPDIAWIEDSVRLGEVSQQLMKIKNAERNGEHYYVELHKYADNYISKHESTYEKMHYSIDVGYRLLALFRYWNIIQYYYPYKYLIGEDWQDVLTEFIPQFIDTQNRKEYELVLLKLFARIHDSHAFMEGGLEIEDIKGKNIAPVGISFVEGKAVITHLFPRNDSILKIGDIISSINKEPVDSIIQQKSPYIAASNYPALLRNIAFELLRTNKDQLLVDFERNGVQLSDSIACYPALSMNIPWKMLQQDKPFYQLLSNNEHIVDISTIAYLYLGSQIGGIIPSKIDAKGIIIDLRCYPSNSIEGYRNFSQLYPDIIEFTKGTNGSIIIPGLFTFTEPIKIGEKNANYYKGKKVILINEITQSQAEFKTMIFRYIPNTVVIGSTTAGADGNVSTFPLPGNIIATISGLGVYYPDGGETQRIGIVPDIEIKPTIQGIREGRDEVLEKAIEIINLGNIVNH